MSRLRVVLLTSGSPWQRALANRLATEESLRLVGIVIQSMPRSMRINRLACIEVRSCGATARVFALARARATLLIQQAMLSASFICVSIDIMNPLSRGGPNGAFSGHRRLR